MSVPTLKQDKGGKSASLFQFLSSLSKIDVNKPGAIQKSKTYSSRSFKTNSLSHSMLVSFLLTFKYNL